MGFKTLAVRLKELPKGITSIRTYANAAVCPVEHRNQSSELPWEQAIPYQHIPGPKSFPIVGNMMRFLPFIGKREENFHHIS